MSMYVARASRSAALGALLDAAAAAMAPNPRLPVINADATTGTRAADASMLLTSKIYYYEKDRQGDKPHHAVDKHAMLYVVLTCLLHNCWVMINTTPICWAAGWVR